jgi:uncharacterized protein (DUF58 family)
MFEYSRDLAASIADIAIEAGDPLGLYFLTEDGLTARPPASNPQQYQAVRESILSATTADPETNTPTDREPVTTPTARLARHLDTDTSTVARTLQPFLTTVPTQRQTDESTLAGAIDRIDIETTGQRWFVIITSDGDREAMRAALSRATATEDHVSVFLTPRVLFERDSLTDLETAYDRYQAFEEYRHSLSARPRVAAYELAPGDRIDAVLRTRDVSQV